MITYESEILLFLNDCYLSWPLSGFAHSWITYYPTSHKGITLQPCLFQPRTVWGYKVRRLGIIHDSSRPPTRD